MKKIALIILTTVWGLHLFAQGLITIHHKTQRHVGTESTLNRGKYLTFHSWFKNEDADFERFKKKYNIDPSYNGSRLFNNPGGRHKKGKFPQVKQKYSGIRDVSNFVSTGSPKFFFYDKKVDYSEVDVSEFSKDAARFAADYFSYEADFVPKYYEPFNEPMIHARDFLADGNKSKNKRQKVENIIAKMIDYHADVIEAVNAKPELEKMLVGGFGSAFPEFETNNFGLWNARFKKFIDRVGKDIDFFALHLYDGSGVNNKTGRRSGSNSEAILDLLEAYSYIKLGQVKPYAITEYGRLVPDQPDYKTKGNYDSLVNAQAVRSQMHFVMNFIERGDKLLLSTPFTVGKQKPTGRYSKSSMWVKQDDGSYELSQRKYFFEIWKDVKGERVYINSTNIDVQTQAFVSGKQVHVVLNNLHESTQNIDLKLVDAKGLKNVEIKRLMIYADKLPEMSHIIQNKAPAKVNIQYGETVVLTYTFKSPVEFDNQIYSKKFYADSYLQPIKANEVRNFRIKKVEMGRNGVATLRLGLGRNHGQSLIPSVKLNGNIVEIKGDIIRGGEQKMRKRFFGVLEIPVKKDYLKSGENIVEVSFPDGGGHIASVILQVQKADKPL